MGALNVSENETDRYLYYLSSSTTKLVKPKRTNVSKQITYSPEFRHEGSIWLINVNKDKQQGVYIEPMHRAISQLEVCQSKWNRVFVYMFNLHQTGVYRPDSKWITRFRKNLNRKLERAYGMSEVGFIWVRENEKAKGQHYHLSLFLDGNKINAHHKLKGLIDKTWLKISGNKATRVQNPFYDIKNNDVKQDAINRISYLCKVRGKGYRPKQSKDYSTSRLKAKHGLIINGKN